MADIASLLVRIGADASSYLATTQRVKSATAQVFGAMRGVLRATSDDLTGALGIKIPTAVQGAVRAFDQYSTAMGMLGKNISLASNVAKVGAGPLAMLVEATAGQ